MAEIEITYESMDKVPAPYKDLYEEKDGKAVLSHVNGLKTQADVDYVLEALRKEKDDHKKIKDAVKAWDGLKPEEVRTQLARIPELEAAAEGKVDDEKINKIVESRISQVKGPLERQISQLTEEKTGLEKERGDLYKTIERRDLREAVRGVATEMKVVSTAIPDVEMVAELYLEKDENGKFITKDGVNGVTPGLDVKNFMKEMQKARPHWWPESEGGGARGGGPKGFTGPNPWSADGWNVTEQHRIYSTEGREMAERLAKSAGTTLGGKRPAAKS